MEDIEKGDFSMLAAHYIQKEQINKGFPGDRLKWALAQDLDPTGKVNWSWSLKVTDHYNVAREDALPERGEDRRIGRATAPRR